MNVSRKDSSNEILEIKLFDPNNKEKYKIIEAKRNEYTVVDVENYSRGIDQEKTFFLTSNSCSFIPLILSFDYQSKQLSIEHNHPPSEYFFGQEKFNYIGLIKKRWV